jgi:hypothetical protein
VQWLRRLEDLYLKVTERLGRRGMLALTALSLVYGAVSGVTLTRDYAHSRLLVGSLAGLVLVSAAWRLWGEYARRTRARGATVSGMRGALLDRPRLVTGAAQALTQACTQYIMMFCLPLLVFAHAWITATLAGLVILSSIVDRWWRKLAERPWYVALVRSFAAVLSTSFAFGVLFPHDLALFYPVLGGVAVAAALPWNLIVHQKRPRVADLSPVLVVLALVLGQAALNTWIRVPLLSVWLHRPVFGTGLADRSLTDVWPSMVPQAKLADALASGQELCCLTPVVAPSGVTSPLTHE